MKILRTAASLLGCLALACAPGGRGVTTKPHGVLVIAIDCLRADHTSAYGYDRQTTPFLASLCDEGIRFNRTFVPAPDFLGSHVALLTGCDPRIAVRPDLPGLNQLHLYIPKSVPRLARSFLAAGYRTSVYADNPEFSEARGFGSGFEKVWGFREGELPLNYGLAGCSLRLKRWLRGLDEDEDWFAYLQVQDLERIWREQDEQWDHYFEPRPELAQVPPLSNFSDTYFAVPKRRWSGGARTLGEYEVQYDGNLREIDQHLERLVAYFERKGLWDTTTLVVVGTYGIGFGEEGLLLDTGTLTEVDLHVPWIIRPAPSLGLPRDIELHDLASTLDLAPTLLDLCRIPIPDGMHGVSHKPAVLGEATHAREVTFAAGGVQDGYAVITPEHSFLHVVPGSRGPRSLRVSWSGSEAAESEWVEELLAARTRERLPLERRYAAELREQGQEWFTWMGKARSVLHPAPGLVEGPDEELLESLRERGLIAGAEPALD